MKRLILCWTILIIATGCLWNESPLLTPTSVLSSRSVGSLENFPWRERWRLQLNLFGYYQNVRNLVAIQDGCLFIDEWTLKFVEAKQGDLRWSVDFDGPIDSVVVGENLVYVAGHAGKIVEAYNLETGDLAWKLDTQLPGHTAYYLYYQEDTLLVYDTWDSLYIVKSRNGEMIERSKGPQIGQNPFSLLRLDEQSWLQSDGTQIMLIKDDEAIWKVDLDG
ncbi:MAG: PQQ-binding-like beta-propeller repeat protein, partial [Anaerolineae bacterium]|nr:PQQ-binding-like beta-propeller repeat protein [Anaerolineae bacterium]